MPRRLSVLLPTILVCCIPICLFVAVASIGYIILIPAFLAGALLGPLTLLYLVSNQPPLIVAVLILTALLITMILAHPIKIRPWAATITVIGVCIWMTIGFFSIAIVLSMAAA